MMGTLFLDLSKAFDFGNHDLLLINKQFTIVHNIQ